MIYSQLIRHPLRRPFFFGHLFPICRGRNNYTAWKYAVKFAWFRKKYSPIDVSILYCGIFIIQTLSFYLSVLIFEGIFNLRALITSCIDRVVHSYSYRMNKGCSSKYYSLKALQNILHMSKVPNTIFDRSTISYDEAPIWNLWL